jgi:peptidoglycan/xylan/chitin deacetylase (PgdA/CDA1 family)
LFRAPFGAIDGVRARGAVLGRGYTLVRWSIDPRDWEAPDAHEVLRNFRARLDHEPDGGIVLLHDVHPHTIEAFPRILDEVARRNAELVSRGERPFEIVGLEEFFRLRGVEPPEHARAGH